MPGSGSGAMKQAWIGAVALGGLAALVWIGRGHLGGGSEESTDGTRSGGGAEASRRLATGAGGANRAGNAANGGAAGAPAAGSAGSDGPTNPRAGVAAVRGAPRGDGASVESEAVDRAAVGSIGATRLDVRPSTTKREVPDMPKQVGHGIDSIEAQNEAPPPEPAPEIAYDGGPDHVFTTDWQVEVPDAGRISGDAGTVSFWLKPQWQGTNQDDATFVQLGDSGMQVVKNVNYLRFEYIDATGKENGLGLNIGDWRPGDWHQVTTTWANGNLALYVDGQQVSQERYPNPPTFGSETKLYVGSNFPGTPVAQGDISYLRVLNRDSPASEVGDQFRSGPRPSN
jgi:hypothetical protein